MDYEAIILERQGPVAIMTLNRPEVLNAINDQITRDIHAGLDEVAADTAIRVLILTGAGRGFCSGADVRGLARRADGEGPNNEGRDLVAQSTAAASIPVHLRRTPQPVIGALNGIAAGMGLGIALACDIRIASEEARVSSIFIKRSIMPDNGVSHTISKLAGYGIAAEMALTGNIYNAEWAMSKGLVNSVVPHESLMDETMAMAETIAGNPPIGVRLTKQILYRNLYANLEQSITNESYFNSLTFQTEDYKEAVRSFLEKRQPVFKNQ